MTNYEWLHSLSDKELAGTMFDVCLCCNYHDAVGCKGGNRICKDGILEWLNKKHIEPMPSTQVGDIINVKYASSFEIKGTIVGENVVFLNQEGFGCQSFKGHIESLCTEIKRYNEFKGEMETIWKADNQED